VFYFFVKQFFFITFIKDVKNWFKIAYLIKILTKILDHNFYKKKLK
jgi:hypothetical protein